MFDDRAFCGFDEGGGALAPQQDITRAITKEQEIQLRVVNKELYSKMQTASAQNPRPNMGEQ